MASADETVTHTRELVKHGVALAVGLVLVAYSANTYLWYSYMHANPDVGPVSLSNGFLVFYLVVFVIGIIIAYVAFGRGLYSILGTG